VEGGEDVVGIDRVGVGLVGDGECRQGSGWPCGAHGSAYCSRWLHISLRYWSARYSVARPFLAFTTSARTGLTMMSALVSPQPLALCATKSTTSKH